jgi:hypothetical protein
MSSSLQAWRDGKSLWSVSHDPDRALDDLKTAGEPPAELAEIAAHLAAEQAEEDESVDVIFEAPLELCKQLCGYRPDEVVSGPWIELEPRPGRVGGPAPGALPEAIGRDLAPTLADHGWAAGEVRISANGGRYDQSRLREARLEAMRLLWSDDGRTPLITASFAILDGSTPDAPLIGVQAVVPDPPSLTRRLLGWAKTFRQDAQTDETRIRDAIVRGRALIADLDAAIDTAVDLGLRRREAHRQAYGGDAPEQD